MCYTLLLGQKQIEILAQEFANNVSGAYLLKQRLECSQ